LKDAARLRLIAHNPASDTELPKAQRSEMRAWGAEDAERFLAATRGTRLYPLWRLALATGLRRGELCGLRWSDVDLVAGTASVAHTRTTAGKAITSQPKTDAGYRTISLDAGTVTVLRAWKKRQLEERMAAGPAWIESPYMFTHEDGQPPHPGWVTKRWNGAVVAAGVPPIRLHDARHSALGTRRRRSCCGRRCRRRWFRSGSGTPTSGSRCRYTPTSPPRMTRQPPMLSAKRDHFVTTGVIAPRSRWGLFVSEGGLEPPRP
jgi:integrase